MSVVRVAKHVCQMMHTQISRNGGAEGNFSARKMINQIGDVASSAGLGTVLEYLYPAFPGYHLQSWPSAGLL